MVVYLADEGKVELPCQPKDNQQRATKLLNDFRIDVADDLSDTVSSQCHHLVSHDLRAQAKPILLLRLYDWTQGQPILDVGGDGADENGRKFRDEFVRLHDNAGPWSA